MAIAYLKDRRARKVIREQIEQGYKVLKIKGDNIWFINPSDCFIVPWSDKLLWMAKQYGNRLIGAVEQD